MGANGGGFIKKGVVVTKIWLLEVCPINMHIKPWCIRDFLSFQTNIQ